MRLRISSNKFTYTLCTFVLLNLQQKDSTYQELTHQFVPALYDNNTVTGGMTGGGRGGGEGGSEGEGGSGGGGGARGEGDFRAHEEMRGRGQYVEHNFSAHQQAPPLYVNSDQVGGGRKGGGGGDTYVYDVPRKCGTVAVSKECTYSVVKKPSIKN